MTVLDRLAGLEPWSVHGALTTIRGLALMPLYDWPEYHGETDALWDRIRAAGRDRRAGSAARRSSTGTTASPRGWMKDWCSASCAARPGTGTTGAGALSGVLRAGAGRGAGGALFQPCHRPHGPQALSSLDDIEQAGRARFAFNEPDSQSGVHCLRARFDMDAQLARGLHSGGHRHSIDAVLAGDADFAAIDACSFRLYAGLFPARLDGLRIVAQTPLRPAPVLITSATLDGDTAELAAVRADRLLGRPLRRRWWRSAGSRREPMPLLARRIWALRPTGCSKTMPAPCPRALHRKPGLSPIQPGSA